MKRIVKKIESAAKVSLQNKQSLERIEERKQDLLLVAEDRETIFLSEIFLLFMLVMFLLASSCSSVKGYEKMYLNDAEMALDAQKIEKFELSFQTYREGASGATGGKSSGGCGCN